MQSDPRRQLIELARAHDVLPVAIVLDLPERVCLDRNAARPDRDFGDAVVRRQRDQLRRSLKGLAREGFRTVHVLRTEQEVADAVVVRRKLLTDFRDDHGPFDVIGDVHGCRDELESLLARLGYTVVNDDHGRAVDAIPPVGRKAVFVGDLVDRGPDSPGVLRLVMGMVAAGHARCVAGNHESKLVKALRGRKVQVSHGLETTLAQLAAESAEFRASVETFCYDLLSHLVLDNGNLVVAHAGLKEAYHGRASARVRSFALYGDTTGETDEFGLPVRLPWANDYRGRAMVLYGHTPTPTAEWVNNTMCLDTGCVFGGTLTALRYPEKELVGVPAEREWYPPAKPFLAPSRGGRATRPRRPFDHRRVGSTQYRDPLGRKGFRPCGERGGRTRGDEPVRPRAAPAALPAADHGTHEHGTIGEFLEHPGSAFEAYRRSGVTRVICEEKHMGSRAVVLVCRTDEVMSGRFGVADRAGGAMHTRTGRSFFPAELTQEFLARVRAAAGAAGLWDELDTDWLLLDAELLPWSVKAEELLREQYASVGAAALAAVPAAVAALQAAAQRGQEVGALLARTRSRAANAEQFRAAYRRYVWPTSRTGRGAAGPVPAARVRGCGLAGTRPRMAPRAGGPAGRRRARPDHADAAARGRHHRPRVGGGRDRVVA